MNKLIKLISLATVFTVIVGCGNNDKKSRAEADEANKKLSQMQTLENSLAGKPITQSGIDRLSIQEAAEFKITLDEIVKLGNRVIQIDNNNKDIGIKNRPSLEKLISDRSNLVKLVNERLNKGNALDGKGQLKPEFQPPKTQSSSPDKTHKHH